MNSSKSMRYSDIETHRNRPVYTQVKWVLIENTFKMSVSFLNNPVVATMGMSAICKPGKRYSRGVRVDRTVGVSCISKAPDSE